MVAALEKKKMLEDSIIVITTDNGGPAAGFNQNAASNWPLRGVKDTLWEGGVRGAGQIRRAIATKAPLRVQFLLTFFGVEGGREGSIESQ